MAGYLLKHQSIAVHGVDNLAIRSLLDRQQFFDPLGEAERRGISSASWPLFGLLWPSGVHLAARMAQRPVAAGERILEIGCGLALAALVRRLQALMPTLRAVVLAQPMPELLRIPRPLRQSALHPASKAPQPCAIEK